MNQKEVSEFARKTAAKLRKIEKGLKIMETAPQANGLREFLDYKLMPRIHDLFDHFTITKNLSYEKLMDICSQADALQLKLDGILPPYLIHCQKIEERNQGESNDV